MSDQPAVPTLPQHVRESLPAEVQAYLWALEQQVVSLREQVAALQAQVASQQQQIERLRAQLNQHSQNFAPAVVGPSTSEARAKPTETGRAAGAQGAAPGAAGRARG